uniref:Reticulon n=1 Tax=Eptatretus burgeri TaxID=7764 RepID=A0A8C4WUT1_EPTBU
MAFKIIRRNVTAEDAEFSTKLSHGSASTFAAASDPMMASHKVTQPNTASDSQDENSISATVPSYIELSQVKETDSHRVEMGEHDLFKGFIGNEGQIEKLPSYEPWSTFETKILPNEENYGTYLVTNDATSKTEPLATKERSSISDWSTLDSLESTPTDDFEVTHSRLPIMPVGASEFVESKEPQLFHLHSDKSGSASLELGSKEECVTALNTYPSPEEDGIKLDRMYSMEKVVFLDKTPYLDTDSGKQDKVAEKPACSENITVEIHREPSRTDSHMDMDSLDGHPTIYNTGYSEAETISISQESSPLEEVSPMVEEDLPVTGAEVLQHQVEDLDSEQSATLRGRHQIDENNLKSDFSHMQRDLHLDTFHHPQSKMENLSEQIGFETRKPASGPAASFATMMSDIHAPLKDEDGGTELAVKNVNFKTDIQVKPFAAVAPTLSEVANCKVKEQQEMLNKNWANLDDEMETETVSTGIPAVSSYDKDFTSFMMEEHQDGSKQQEGWKPGSRYTYWGSGGVFETEPFQPTKQQFVSKTTDTSVPNATLASLVIDENHFNMLSEPGSSISQPDEMVGQPAVGFPKVIAACEPEYKEQHQSSYQPGKPQEKALSSSLFEEFLSPSDSTQLDDLVDKTKPILPQSVKQNISECERLVEVHKPSHSLLDEIVVEDVTKMAKSVFADVPSFQDGSTLDILSLKQSPPCKNDDGKPALPEDPKFSDKFPLEFPSTKSKHQPDLKQIHQSQPPFYLDDVSEESRLHHRLDDIFAKPISADWQGEDYSETKSSDSLLAISKRPMFSEGLNKEPNVKNASSALSSSVILPKEESTATSSLQDKKSDMCYSEREDPTLAVKLIEEPQERWEETTTDLPEEDLMIDEEMTALTINIPRADDSSSTRSSQPSPSDPDFVPPTVIIEGPTEEPHYDEPQLPVKIGAELETGSTLRRRVIRPTPWMMSHIKRQTVQDLLYWCDVRSSTVVFVALLLMLITVSTFSILSVIGYMGLAILGVTIPWRVARGVVCAMQKRADGHPFRAYLDADISLHNEQVMSLLEPVRMYTNATTRELLRLVLVYDIVDSIKFLLILWLSTYVGAYFNALTLLILGVIFAFSLPITYDKYKIKHILAQIRAQIHDMVARVRSLIPTGKPQEALKAQ